MKESDYVRKTLCDDCPFMTRGKGFRLRKSLGPGRWQEITRGLLKGEHFFCHKTTYGDDVEQTDDDDCYTPGRRDRICAGAVRWQAKRGIVADALQVLDRLRKMRLCQKLDEHRPLRSDARQTQSPLHHRKESHDS